MPPKRLLKLNISSGGDPQDRPDETPEPKKVPDRIVQVDDHLFLSGAKAASNIDSLRENKINVIISMIHTKDMQLFPEEIIYIENPIADNASQDITGVLREIPARIADHIQAGRNVLVHCQEGISRAPTVIIAYLMTVNGQDYDFNVAKLRKVSPKVDPNLVFYAQICSFYASLKQKNQGDSTGL